MADRRNPLTGSESDSSAPPEGAPLAGTRDEALQRLQVGVLGLAAMVLIVGLAGIIGGQADLTQQGAVPDAAPTTEPTAAAPQRDPLADAGVVPDIPAEPTPSPTDAIVTPAPVEGPAGPGNGTPQQ